MTGRVDAHHHVFARSLFPQDWLRRDAGMSVIDHDYSIADLLPLAEAEGIGQTVLVQTQHNEDETRYFLSVAAQEPLVAAVIGWTDLEAPGVADAVAALQEAPGGQFLRGMRHLVQSEDDEGWLARKSVRRGLTALADAGLTFDLVIKPQQFAAAAAVVHEMPHVSFVLDHLAKPVLTRGGDLTGWAADMRRFAAASNAAGKLSGLVTEAAWDSWTIEDLQPAVDAALDTLGPDRLMFGSDWPVSLVATDYTTWAETAEKLVAGLSESELEGVFGGTARAVYRLD